MTKSKTLNEGQVKKLHQLENMALMLDKGCQVGELADANVEKAQTILNKISEVLIDESDVIGPRLYIVYENQALLHWIYGSEDDARDFAKIAIKMKGDGVLLTKTANELIGDDTIAPKTQPDESDTKLVGVKGWLALFVVGLVISTTYNLYSAIIGFADTDSYAPAVVAAYPSLPAIVNFENIMVLFIAIFGIYLIIMIKKLQKKTIKTAIIYAIAIIAFEFVDILIVYLVFGGNKTAIDAAFGDGMVTRTIIISFIWLLYFVYSKRVKQTFTRG